MDEEREAVMKLPPIPKRVEESPFWMGYLAVGSIFAIPLGLSYV